MSGKSETSDRLGFRLGTSTRVVNNSQRKITFQKHQTKPWYLRKFPEARWTNIPDFSHPSKRTKWNNEQKYLWQRGLLQKVYQFEIESSRGYFSSRGDRSALSRTIQPQPKDSPFRDSPVRNYSLLRIDASSWLPRWTLLKSQPISMKIRRRRWLPSSGFGTFGTFQFLRRRQTATHWQTAAIKRTIPERAVYCEWPVIVNE